MLVHCGLLLLFLNCVRTTEYVNSNGVVKDRVAEFNKRFSWWPSVHNAASLVKVKREAAQVSEGQPVGEGGKLPLPTPAVSPAPGANNTLHSNTKQAEVSSPTGHTKSSVWQDTQITCNREAQREGLSTGLKNPTGKGKRLIILHIVPGNATVTIIPTVINSTVLKVNTTAEKTKEIDLNNPGVLKRGFIVFGGFALLAVAYFIFYRRKGKNNETSNAHSSNDANQFRYGVLQSEDRRDNLELSRVPLTMESDDDEDEDLEIFDLEQKKKSLSYVNLQTNDEDVVFSNKDYTENDRENLLLDIEDGTSQTLINWSGSGSKSIL